MAAPAGRGKSALLTRFVVQLREESSWEVVFVPISLRFGTAHPAVFLRELCTKLAHFHGVPLTRLSGSTADWEGHFEELFARPIERDRRLLVVIDGIDEAAGWRVGEGFLPDLSNPGLDFGSRLKVIVAARGEPEDWRRQLGWNSRVLAHELPLALLDRTGIREALDALGNPIDHLPEPERWIDLLFEKTQSGAVAGDLRHADALAGEDMTEVHLTPASPCSA